MKRFKLKDLTNEQLIELVHTLAHSFYEHTSIKRWHWEQIVISSIDEVKND